MKRKKSEISLKNSEVDLQMVYIQAQMHVFYALPFLI